jgi:ABC-type branched-subunit amino acid transport system substrate-binding protein
MVQKGVELAFDEARSARAPGTPDVELVLREDAPTWGSVTTSFVELAMRERVLAVIGSVDSAATHVALRAALKLGVLIVNTASSDPTVTETAIPWILRCFPDDRQQGYALALHLVKTRGCRRIVVLRANDRYGRYGIKEFQDAVRRLGSPVLVEMRYAPGDRQFATQLARLRAAEPDAVVFWGDGEDLGHAARALREAGVEAPFFGPDRLVDPAFLRAAGPAAEGTTATYPFDPARPDPAWQAFRRRFRARFDLEPDHFAACSYDGARILLAALEQSGADRVALRSVVASVSTHHGVSGTLRFDPTLNDVTPPILMQVTDGVFRAE